MSDNRDRGTRDFSRFDSMSTEALQQILRQDALSPVDEETDTEMLFYIMEVLAKRKKQETPGTNIQKAYDSFVQNYMPCPDDPEEPDQVVRFTPQMPRWLRSAAVIAVVLALLALGTVSADAMGFNVFGMVANWTAEVFHFSSATEGTEFVEPEQDKTAQYTSLQEALDIYKIEQRLVPTWLPDGYELVEVEILDSPFEVSFYAIYSRENTRLQISVRQLLGSDSEQIEKKEGLVEIYKPNDIEYYLFQNEKRTQAVWANGEFECIIAGCLTIEEIKAMIDSI